MLYYYYSFVYMHVRFWVHDGLRYLKLYIHSQILLI